MPVEPRSNGAAGAAGAADANDELVMNLVAQALDLPAEARETHIRNACGENPSLFSTVWGYVHWDERMNDFLLHPVYSLLAEEAGLEPGQILENRFRIVRKVAAGGMGVVYEARDEKLGRTIAIKCAKAGFRARLSPEVLHASEINHPNICKTWEIHTGRGPQGEFDFFTMEFIEGKNLAERLREGPVPATEARTIAAQLCAGLAEAHRHHVIHGDLKSNNVLLADAPENTRVVITDFGLALSWSTQASLTNDLCTAPQQVAGTPDYMAPELFNGERPSAASDIYALGVILHELAAGRKPFDMACPLSERATRRPATLKHPWGRTISRCLEPDPARRCANAAEVAAALVPFPLRRWLAIAAAIAVAAVGGAAAYRTAGVSQEVVRLAILPFTTAAETKSLSDGLLQDTSDRLRHVRDNRRKFTVIPMRDAARSKVDTPERAVSMLGATHILTGLVRRDNGRVIIQASLTDARSRLQLTQWTADYSPNELWTMPIALAGIVTGTLHLPPLVTTTTVNAAAYSDFAAGMGLLQRDSGVEAAIPYLTKAVATDPDSPITHARLAEAEAREYRLSLSPVWLERATKSLHEAQQRNPDLALVWLVSSRINEYGGFYEKAESDLQRALQLDPRDGDAWRRLGVVYQENSRFAESAAAFQKAIESQPGYFSNYLDLCALYTQQANYSEAINQCRKLIELAPDFSDAHFVAALPYAASGDYARSEAEFQLAIKLDPASSKAIYSYAYSLAIQGRPADAIPLFQRALAIGPPTHLLYSDLGTAWRLAGFPDKARRAYRQGLDLAETDLERNPRDVISKAQLAYLCARLGDSSRAASEAIQAHQLGPDSIEVDWWLILTWEALGKHDAAFSILQYVPDDTLRRINRDAELADFSRSSRFRELMAVRHIQ